jgi:MFS family permease
MKPLLLVRFWLMVFLHYFVWGAWYVTMGTYVVTKLGFTGGQVGLVYGTTAVGALVSPFIVGIIADRFFATQRILGFLHLAGAGLLYWVSTLQEFGSFYPVLLAYTITYMAGHGLTNALTLHHSKNPAKEFPVVMVMASGPRGELAEAGGPCGHVPAGLGRGAAHGPLLVHAAPHPAEGSGRAGFPGHAAGLRCAEAHARPLFCHLHGLLLPHLRAAEFLLQLDERLHE